MSKLPAVVLLGSLSLAALAGCDAIMFDPNIAHIEAVSIDDVSADVQGQEAIFVRLIAGFDTTDTEATTGPFPITLATRRGFVVTTNDGGYEGQPLSVEVRRCVNACATSEEIGRVTVEPNRWRGSERTVEAGRSRVTLAYRKTSS